MVMPARHTACDSQDSLATAYIDLVTHPCHFCIRVFGCLAHFLLAMTACFLANAPRPRALVLAAALWGQPERPSLAPLLKGSPDSVA